MHIRILQGTLELMILRTLATMGSQRWRQMAGVVEKLLAEEQ
ncbi:MAG: hypothetical protein ABSG96_09795 [Terracidiphilus sp.]|jgi:hypothetical protein